MHKAEIVKIEGQSYRQKEAQEESQKRAKARKEKAQKKEGKKYAKAVDTAGVWRVQGNMDSGTGS